MEAGANEPSRFLFILELQPLEWVLPPPLTRSMTDLTHGLVS